MNICIEHKFRTYYKTLGKKTGDIKARFVFHLPAYFLINIVKAFIS